MTGRTRGSLKIVPVSYTHLDVYKRQICDYLNLVVSDICILYLPYKITISETVVTIPFLSSAINNLLLLVDEKNKSYCNKKKY